MLSIPNKVGIKYFLNNVHTSSVPKSIAFLFICVCYSYGYFFAGKQKMPDKVIGFTQSSYPAFLFALR